MIGYPVGRFVHRRQKEIHARVGGRTAGAGRRGDLSARDRDPSTRDAGNPSGRGRQHDDVQEAAAEPPVVGGYGGGGVRLRLPGARADLGLADPGRAAAGVGAVVRAADECPDGPSPRHRPRLGVGAGADVRLGDIRDDGAGAAGQLPAAARRLGAGGGGVHGGGAGVCGGRRPQHRDANVPC